ncbi:MAG: isopenicillin N synthase family oxygenase [Pseudomonadota bacterium]|nr:isopenicillin N synthase family oxygenase [Pseudomonadota bacterium]
MEFPALDLARFEAASPAGRRAIGAEVDSICRATGFLNLTGHGVPEPTIATLWRAAEAFFALPMPHKLAAKAPVPGYPYGYLPPLAESLARSQGVNAPPDLKESFNGGPEAAPSDLDDAEALAFCYAPTIWPEAPAGFRAAWSDYYRAMESLAARVMRVFATALDLPEAFFAPFIDSAVSALRALNYPALQRPPEAGQIRAGAHTDYGSLTILLPQAGSRGLEIFSPEGRWVEIPPAPGAFVINIGDLMARWTNDRWVSTLHRVVVPPNGGAERRQSFAFFHQPNWDAVITPLPGEAPKYAPVRSGPYLMAKFKSTTM